MSKKSIVKRRPNHKNIIGGAAAGFLLLALVSGGIYFACRPDGKSAGSLKDGDRTQGISFSDVCKSIDVNRLRDTIKAISVELNNSSVTRMETNLYVQNSCNLIVSGDVGIKGYINIVVQDFKDSTERDNQKLQVETFGKSVKGSEKVDGMGDVAYFVSSSAGSRIVATKNGKRLTVIYPLASQGPVDKEKLKEIAKGILAKL
jgi:hypothetical protein